MHVASDLSDPENQDQAMDTAEETPENIGNGEESIAEEDGNQELSEDEVEYLALDKQLDDLNRALDMLEQKNDNIHAQLKVLLETNRDIKKTSEANNEEQK